MRDLKGEYTEGTTVMLAPDPGANEQEIVVMDLGVAIDGVASVVIGYVGGQNIVNASRSIAVSAEAGNYRFRAGGTGRALTIDVVGSGTVRTFGRAFIVKDATAGNAAWRDELAVPA